jgi:TolB protein
VKSFRKITLLVTAAGLFLFLPWPAGSVRAQEEVRVKIGSSGRAETKVGVEPFWTESDADRLAQYRTIAYSILVSDLRFSLRFNVAELTDELRLKPYEDLERRNGDLTKIWEGAGVDGYIRGTLSQKGQEFVIDWSLRGPLSEKPLVEKTYSAKRSDFRHIVHRISDDVIFAMTGERGISQTRIAYISRRTGHKELFVSDCDGFNEKQLTNYRVINLSPEWSPSGDEIIFTSYREGNPDLYILNLRTNAVRKYISYEGINNAATWSPDGKEVAVTLSKDGNPEIYAIDFWTGKIRRLTHWQGIDTSPSWSPTGQEIAFTSDRAGTPAIYIMGRDGSNVRRISFVGNYNVAPAWSPMGDRIAFVGRSVDEGNTDLYIIEVSSGDVMRVTAIGDNVDPSWSPDGYHVAFASNRDGSYDIYSATWDGADLNRITYSGQNYSPAWSPFPGVE